MRSERNASRKLRKGRFTNARETREQICYSQAEADAKISEFEKIGWSVERIDTIADILIISMFRFRAKRAVFARRER